MQDFNKVNLTDLVRDAIVKLDDTTQSLATSFSGDAFPTNNVEKGMTCYRTDKEILYICTGVDNNGVNVWEEIGHIGIKPGTDDSGNTISSTYTTQTTAKAMQNSIDTANTNIQDNKKNLANHITDTSPHASVFNKYLKTADLTPVKLYNVLHSYGPNFVPSDVTNRGWGSLGTFISSYNQYKFKNQPTQYGQLVNICADDYLESTQLWIEQNSGTLYFRGGNGAIVMNDRAFTKVATYPELESAQNTLQNNINNVSAKAGIIAGNISDPNAWWVKLGGTIPLIIQGGTMYVNRIDDGWNYTLWFPISFNARPTVSSTIIHEGRISGTANIYNGTPSNSSVVFYSDASDDSMWGASVTWMAIGKG